MSCQTSIVNGPCLTQWTWGRETFSYNGDLCISLENGRAKILDATPYFNVKQAMGV